jgi:hypothetical protein
MTGVELAREVRRQRPQLPILLATGFAELDGVKVADVERLAKRIRRINWLWRSRVFCLVGCKLRELPRFAGIDRGKILLTTTGHGAGPEGATVVMAGDKLPATSRMQEPLWRTS